MAKIWVDFGGSPCAAVIAAQGPLFFELKKDSAVTTMMIYCDPIGGDKDEETYYCCRYG